MIRFLKPVVEIAVNSYREMIRERFFLIVVFVSILLLGLSLLLGSLSFAEQQRILIDLGLAAVEVSALGIVLIAGSFTLAREIEKQTCLVLLAKPLSRSQFLVGKWLGVFFVVSITEIVLFGILGLLSQQPMELTTVFQIFASIWLQMALILALVFLMSCWVRPIFSFLFGLTIYLLGHWLHDLEYFALKTQDEGILQIYRFVHAITPQFYRFNWKSFYFLEKGISSFDFSWMLLYMSGWTLGLLYLSVLFFRRKDIV